MRDWQSPGSYQRGLVDRHGRRLSGTGRAADNEAVGQLDLAASYAQVVVDRQPLLCS